MTSVAKSTLQTSAISSAGPGGAETGAEEGLCTTPHACSPGWDIWSGSGPSRGCPEAAASLNSPRDPSHKQDHLQYIILLPSIPRQAEGKDAWGRSKCCRLGTMACAPLWPDPPFLSSAFHWAMYSHQEETFLLLS